MFFGIIQPLFQTVEQIVKSGVESVGQSLKNCTLAVQVDPCIFLHDLKMLQYILQNFLQSFFSFKRAFDDQTVTAEEIRISVHLLKHAG